MAEQWTSEGCKYKIEIQDTNFHPGGTVLRIETFSPAARCTLKKKREDIDTFRWIGSGGSAMDILRPCSGNCKLKVRAEIGNYGQIYDGPCPFCRILNSRKGTYGEVICRKCGEKYFLVE